MKEAGPKLAKPGNYSLKGGNASQRSLTIPQVICRADLWAKANTLCPPQNGLQVRDAREWGGERTDAGEPPPWIALLLTPTAKRPSLSRVPSSATRSKGGTGCP